MLTGDNRTIAEAIAQRFGIDDVEADVLPEDKDRIVRKLRADGKIVAMAGDGVNDAPALAEADVGLKLDTQGFDLAAIKGAGKAMERVRALQTEVSVVPLYHGMTDWQSSIETVKNYGFELSGWWAVAREAALRVSEFDCVMVRPIGCSPTCASSGNGREDGPD